MKRHFDSRDPTIPAGEGNDSEASGISRRDFLRSSAAGAVAGAMGGTLLSNLARAADGENAANVPDGTGRTLIHSGCVLSMDPDVGDFEEADVLIDGKHIVDVAPNLKKQNPDAFKIDASGMIVLPGLIDTHRHCWQDYFRRAIPNADITDYVNFTHRGFAPYCRPQDHYAGNLLADLGAIYTGVTSVLDYSHNSRSKAHVDEAIRAHFESGLRAVFAYGPVSFGEWEMQWPQDIQRVKDQYFASDDQLVSLRLAPPLVAEYYILARQVGVRITTDGPATGPTGGAMIEALGNAGLLGPDVTLVHGTDLPDSTFQMMASTGTRLALATTSDAHFRGLANSQPPIQKALDYGLVTGMSVDVPVSLSGDFFSQMRATFYFQRLQANKRWADGEPNPPAPMTLPQVLHMATVGGALCNGVESKAGKLAPGMEADIIMMEAEDILTMPLNNAMGTVVLGGDVGSVRHVMIAGAIKKWKGKLVDVDLNRVSRLVHESRDYLASASGLWDRSDILGLGPLYE